MLIIDYDCYENVCCVFASFLPKKQMVIEPIASIVLCD